MQDCWMAVRILVFDRYFMCACKIKSYSSSFPFHCKRTERQWIYWIMVGWFTNVYMVRKWNSLFLLIFIFSHMWLQFIWSICIFGKGINITIMPLLSSRNLSFFLQTFHKEFYWSTFSNFCFNHAHCMVNLYRYSIWVIHRHKFVCS